MEGWVVCDRVEEGLLRGSEVVWEGGRVWMLV